MAESAFKEKKIKKLTRKQVQQEVGTRLSGALGEYKIKLGEKKFGKNIKKLSRLLAVDLTKALTKEAKVPGKNKAAKSK